MLKHHVKYVVSPCCKRLLSLAIETMDGDHIETGSLSCDLCAQQYPIIKGVPRFVDQENYTNSFGFQWQLYNKTQYDASTQSEITRERFFSVSKWSKNLEGQLMLEVGCGSGRFTEQAASTGAMIVSLDFSNAVDASYAQHKEKTNVFIIQADVFHLPFKESEFDYVFCYGVLQHTPDPGLAFENLTKQVKSSGKLSVDIYARYTGLKQNIW